jgi:iron complex transport system substrate-binding protein
LRSKIKPICIYHSFVAWLCVLFGICGLCSAEYPGKIVSLAPNLTEIIFALDEGQHVAGVTDFDHYPPDAQKLPKVGGYLNPDLERIIRIHPDVAVMLEGEIDLKSTLMKLGIEVWQYKCESYEEICSVIRSLGNRLDAQSKAERLLDAFDAAFKKCALASSQHPKVMLVIGSTPGALQNIFVAGGGSFLDYIVTKLGAVNVFHSNSASYLQVSTEEIIARQPEILVEMSTGVQLSESEKNDRIQAWSKLGILPAVRNKQVFILTDDFLLIPGPRIVRTISVLADILNR